MCNLLKFRKSLDNASVSILIGVKARRMNMPTLLTLVIVLVGLVYYLVARLQWWSLGANGFDLRKHFS